MRYFIALSLAAALTLGCASSGRDTADHDVATAEDEDPFERDEKLLGDGLRKVAMAGESATGVTLYEIRNQYDEDYAALKDRPKVASYPIVGSVSLSKEAAAELVQKLVTRDHYNPPTLKSTCMFVPHHALDIVAPSARVTAIICLECGEIEFLVNGESIGGHGFTSEAAAEVEDLLLRLLGTPAA